MHFTKMHGLGNDYLYVYGEVPANIEDLSIKLSERHFGAAEWLLPQWKEQYGENHILYTNETAEYGWSPRS